MIRTQRSRAFGTSLLALLLRHGQILPQQKRICGACQPVLCRKSFPLCPTLYTRYCLNVCLGNQKSSDAGGWLCCILGTLTSRLCCLADIAMPQFPSSKYCITESINIAEISPCAQEDRLATRRIHSHKISLQRTNEVVINLCLFELFESKMPIVVLVTECVSRRRDGR